MHVTQGESSHHPGSHLAACDEPVCSLHSGLVIPLLEVSGPAEITLLWTSCTTVMATAFHA